MELAGNGKSTTTNPRLTRIMLMPQSKPAWSAESVVLSLQLAVLLEFENNDDEIGSVMLRVPAGQQVPNGMSLSPTRRSSPALLPSFLSTTAHTTVQVPNVFGFTELCDIMRGIYGRYPSPVTRTTTERRRSRSVAKSDCLSWDWCSEGNAGTCCNGTHRKQLYGRVFAGSRST